MKRFGKITMLKDDPEIIRKYEEYHANVWPEVLRGITAMGVLRVFIYRHDRTLFMFMETTDEFDPERDVPAYMADPRVMEWESVMRDMQEAMPGSEGSLTWIDMAEVHEFDIKGVTA